MEALNAWGPYWLIAGGAPPARLTLPDLPGQAIPHQALASSATIAQMIGTHRAPGTPPASPADPMCEWTNDSASTTPMISDAHPDTASNVRLQCFVLGAFIIPSCPRVRPVLSGRLDDPSLVMLSKKTFLVNNSAGVLRGGLAVVPP